MIPATGIHDYAGVRDVAELNGAMGCGTVGGCGANEVVNDLTSLLALVPSEFAARTYHE